MPTQIRDYTPVLEEAIAEARAAGFSPAAEELHRPCFQVAFTTGSEVLHEHGIAIRIFLKETGRALPRPIRKKMAACLTEIDLVWPGWRKLLAFFKPRVPGA